MIEEPKEEISQEEIEKKMCQWKKFEIAMIIFIGTLFTGGIWFLSRLHHIIAK
jgi:hypothetical protein